MQQPGQQAADTTASADELESLRAQLREARHEVLISRDLVIGSDAEVGRVNRDLTKADLELRTLRRQVKRLTARRDELQERLQKVRRQSQRTEARLGEEIKELQAALAARTSFPRRVARAVRRRMR